MAIIRPERALNPLFRFITAISKAEECPLFLPLEKRTECSALAPDTSDARLFAVLTRIQAVEAMCLIEK
jgi:hypothetical protein